MDVVRPGAAVRRDRVLDEFFREVTGFGGVHFPADRLAGEDIEHRVQAGVQATPGSFQFRDVPGPDLARAGGDQFGPDPGRVRGLGAALADLAGIVQDPVDGADAAQVAALIQQHRPRLGRGLVREPLAVQHRQHPVPLRLRERGRVGRPRRGRPFLFRCRLRVALPVQRGPGFPQQFTGSFH